MKTREFTVDHIYNGRDLMLVADNVYAHDMKVFQYVGDLSKEDYQEVTGIMAHVYEKLQIEFRNVWLGDHREPEEKIELKTGAL